MTISVHEGAFILIVGFLLTLGIVFLGAALLNLIKHDLEDEYPVDSGLRRSDVGRANSVWGDKD